MAELERAKENGEPDLRAFQQLARRHDHLHLLLDMTNSITSQLNLRQLLSTISDCLRKVIRCDAMAMTLYDSQSGVLRLHVLDADPERISPLDEGEIIPVEDTPVEEVLKSRKTVVINRAYLETFSSPLTKRIIANGVRSGCIAPLISRGQLIGTLDLASVTDNAFAPEDAEPITQIAAQIAIAVDNALNFERALKAEQQMARERQRSELLLEINNKIASSLDLRDIFRAICDCLRTLLGHDYADLGFYNAETNQMRLYAIDRTGQIQFGEEDIWWPIEGTPAEVAIRSRQTIIRDRHDPVEFPSESMKLAYEAGLRSGCAVPLSSRDRVLGVLIVASKREAAFNADDGELLTRIGVQISLAVENALNFEAARAAEVQMAHDRDRLSLLLNATNTIVSGFDLRELIRIISSSVRDTLRHDLMGLSIYDSEINQLRTYMYDFVDNNPFLQEGDPIPLEGSFTGMTFASGKPMFMNVDYEGFTSDFNKRFREAGFKSGGCVPLIAHGRKLGTLGVVTFHEHTYSENEAEARNPLAHSAE
jgi:GAF domain-containing protein